MPNRIARVLPFLLLATSLAVAAPAPPPHAPQRRSPARPAAATKVNLAGRFDETERLVTYHYLLALPGLTEATLRAGYEDRVAKKLDGLVETEPPNDSRRIAYVESPDRGLSRRHVSVRVREGRITVQSWAPTPAQLVDIDSCEARRYEIDASATPGWSVASDINFEGSECKASPVGGTAAGLFQCIEGKCPGLGATLRPIVNATPGLRMGGAAHVYLADADIQLPDAALIRRCSLEIWFFAPTRQYAVFLTYAAFLEDRAKSDALDAALGAKLRARKLVAPGTVFDRYVAAYFQPPVPAKH